MAAIGTIKQYVGSDASNLSIEGKCKISVSIGEKDFYRKADPNTGTNYTFRINNNNIPIQIGHTFMYETGDTISPITFSCDNPPDSFIVNIIYCND